MRQREKIEKAERLTRRGARTSASAPMRRAAGADESRLDAAAMASCLWSCSNGRLVESIGLPGERVESRDEEGNSASAASQK